MVVLTDINEPLLHEAARHACGRPGIGCTPSTDSTSPMPRMSPRSRERINADGGPIDVLVNNAGTVFGGYFLDVPWPGT